MAFTQAQVDLLDANREVIEAIRLFDVQFASARYRIAEGNIARTLGGNVWQPAHGWIRPAPIQNAGALQAVPAIYRVGNLTPSLVMDMLHNPAEWWGAPIQQWLQLFMDGTPVGPAISMHRGQIRDINRKEKYDEEYFEIRAESPLDARHHAPRGEYTDRDQQRRSPGDRGAEYAPTLTNKVIKGWLRG